MNLPNPFRRGAHIEEGWRARRRFLVTFFIALFLLGFAIWLEIQIGDRPTTGEVQRLQGKANAAVGAATSANARLSAVGQPTVQIPSSAAAPTATVTVSGPQGSPGNTGPGPSDAQVTAAVAAYCQSHICSTPPSSSDVAAAVAAYCAAHSGSHGATGQQGAAGQNATTDEIASAVQSYCSANNGCQGPAGVQGPPGADGTTGPEIPSFTFTVPGAFGSTTYICSAPEYQCQAQ